MKHGGPSKSALWLDGSRDTVNDWHVRYCMRVSPQGWSTWQHAERGGCEECETEMDSDKPDSL